MIFFAFSSYVLGDILRTESICSNTRYKMLALASGGKGVFSDGYKVMEKLDALAH